jgi:hypothetical protein
VSWGTTSVVAAAALLATLAGCGERSQKLEHSASKPDAQAWSVSESAAPAYIAPGWKVGDKAAWEEQLRQRNQAQNDYARDSAR